MLDECIVDGCYDDAMEDGELCESHEVLMYEDSWPDFHDEDDFPETDLFDNSIWPDNDGLASMEEPF